MSKEPAIIAPMTPGGEDAVFDDDKFNAAMKVVHDERNDSMSDKELLPCPFCGAIDDSPTDGRRVDSLLIEHKDDCYLKAIIDYYYYDGDTKFTNEEFAAMYSTRHTPSGFKLVPVKANGDIVARMEGCDHGTMADVWEAGVRASPDLQGCNFNEVFKVAPELSFESAKVEVLSGDEVVYSETVPGIAAP